MNFAKLLGKQLGHLKKKKSRCFSTKLLLLLSHWRRAGAPRIQLICSSSDKMNHSLGVPAHFCPRYTDLSTIRHILNLPVFRWGQVKLTWEPALRPVVWAYPRACTSQPITLLLKLIKQIKQFSISATKANAASESRKSQQLFLKLKWAPPRKLDLSGKRGREHKWNSRTRGTLDQGDWKWWQQGMDADIYRAWLLHTLPQLKTSADSTYLPVPRGVHRPHAACRMGMCTTGPGQFSDFSFEKPGMQCFLINYFYILHWLPHPKPAGL